MRPLQARSVVSIEQDSRRREGFSPLQVMEIELNQAIPPIKLNSRYKRAWVLGRFHGEPIGTCVIDVDQNGSTAREFAHLLWLKFGGSIVERFAKAGLPEPTEIGEEGLRIGPEVWPFLKRQSEILADAPFITVLICTRNRPDQLSNCLKCLDLQQYPRFEVIVVENVPTGHVVKVLVETRQGPVPHRYLVEPRSGLSWSRNTGIAAASGEIIAFLDDDGEPDPHWLTGLARGFARGPDIGSVAGLILPARSTLRRRSCSSGLAGTLRGKVLPQPCSRAVVLKIHSIRCRRSEQEQT